MIKGKGVNKMSMKELKYTYGMSYTLAISIFIMTIFELLSSFLNDELELLSIIILGTLSVCCLLLTQVFDQLYRIEKIIKELKNEKLGK